MAASKRADHALVMTDLADSTRLNERLGDAAAADLWAEHDDVARRLMRRHSGTELQRTDGFLMRFEAVDDAIEFSIAYHGATRSLTTPLQARVAIHCGTLETRDADGAPQLHAGIAIPLTARLMAIAGPGQTLISDAARARMHHAGHTGRVARSHGHWRLKGIEEPFEAIEVGDDQAPWSPPPDGEKGYRVTRSGDFWIPRREIPCRLPGQRNTFVGRGEPLRALAGCLTGGARIVSVLGPGGSGKTRLVQHFGRLWLGDYDGGIWFCDLSQATTFDGVLGAIASGLDIPLGGVDPVRQLGDAIAGRGSCLVLLDNVEQVIDVAREPLEQWLDAAPFARFVATTRTVLGIDGEEVLQLMPMVLEEGEELFKRRAVSANAHFTVTSADHDKLHRLIELLEGLPLAIELAAARVRVLGIGPLLERMQQRFSLLASSHGRVTRQSTLRATLDWSWDLLRQDERRALSLASLFEGGFTLPAFEQVACEAPGSMQALDLLQGLIDKSWVRSSGPSRYSMLPSVQEYGRERLADATTFRGSGPELLASGEAAHWRYFNGMSEIEATADRCVELDNHIAATRRATARGRLRDATDALLHSWAALRLTGPFGAVEPLLEDVRNGAGLVPRDAARLHYVAGAVHKHLGRIDAAAIEFKGGLELARREDQDDVRSMNACAYGETLTLAGAFEQARSLLDEALVAASRTGSHPLILAALNGLGGLALAEKDYEQAVSHYGEALRSASRQNDQRWEGGLLGNLGTVLHLQGRLSEAREHYRRALDIAESIGDRRWSGNTRCNLGLLLIDMKMFVESRESLDASLVDARLLGHRRLELTVMWNRGLLAAALGHAEDARRDVEDALAVARVMQDASSVSQLLEVLATLPPERAARTLSSD